MSVTELDRVSDKLGCDVLGNFPSAQTERRKFTAVGESQMTFCGLKHEKAAIGREGVQFLRDCKAPMAFLRIKAGRKVEELS